MNDDARRFLSLLPALSALLLAACASAPTAPPPAENRTSVTAPTAQPAAATASAAIRAAMERDNIPALSVAVMDDGALVWSEAFGVANLENNVAATRDTRFRLGSVSKMFAADLAARMAEQGLVDLDADIRRYLPAFPDKGAPITLRRLLAHTAGVRHYKDSDFDGAQPGGGIDTRLYPDAASILAIFADDPLISAPGAEYHYSTFGYSLVGLVLETAGDKSFARLLDEHILAPAGIDDILPDDLFAIIRDRAGFYDAASDYKAILDLSQYSPIVRAAPLNSAYKVAGGGLIGDAEAVAAFGDLHRKPGFFSEKTFAALFTRQTLTGGAEIPVGLGWRIEQDARGRRIFHHSGSQQGARAHLLIYPDDGVVVAFLTNMGGLPEDSRALATKIAEPFLGQKE